MTNPNHSLIATLIDRSGSMQSIKEDTEGGYTAFMEEQRSSLGEGESIECWLSQFDDRYEAVFTATDISELPAYELHPRGMTALVDSLHRLIGEIGESLALRPEEERPGKVITDKDYRGKLQTVEVVNVKGAVHDAVENVERRVTGLFSSFMK